MLRTGFLTFSAFDTFRSLRFPAAGMHHIVIIICVPVMVYLFRVHHRKQIGDSDLLRTPGHTLAAGRTRDQVHGAENLLYPFYRIHLLI